MDRRSRAKAFAAALGVSILGVLGATGVASAHQLEVYKFQKFFDGTGVTGGTFGSVVGVAVNNSNGNVYVLDNKSGELRVSQLNANGEPVVWSGLEGVSSFPVGATQSPDMIFDNTGHNGGLYVRNGFGGVTANKAFREDGTKRAEGGPGGGHCGLGINPQDGFIWTGTGQWAQRLDPEGLFESPGETFFFEQGPCHFTIDNEGYFWVNRIGGTYPAGFFKFGRESEFGGEFFSEGKLLLQVNYVNTQYSAFNENDNHVFAVETNKVTEYSSEGKPEQTFGNVVEGPFTGLSGPNAVAVNPNTEDVYVTSSDGGSARIDVFHKTETVTVPDATTVAAGHPDGASAVLKGTINADGVATTKCKFEWGATSQYLNGEVPCDQGDVFTGSSNNSVTHELKSLTFGKTYHYRVASKNANERWSYGADRSLEASTEPKASPIIVDRVNTDGARFSSTIKPNGGYVKYHFEYGLEDCASNPCTHLPASDLELKSNLKSEEVLQTTSGLQPNTGYYVRIVATSGAGTAISSYFFHTYPAPPSNDPCSNANVRQQTSASLLPDCRAYELVSAGNAGGYEVESDLVPGQVPFSGYPDATDRVLYGLHFGSVPGIAGSPTNYGVDPYIAERGQSGWTTRYVGLPADGMADPAAFGSPVAGADEGLNSFAFGGTGICNPCFAAGGGTNIPLRLNGGAPTAGMAGTLSPSEPAPSGHVAKYLSADGSHLVFGSTKKFEEAGEEGVLTIYQRDLKAGTTQVVSTDQAGATLSGAVAELDQSSNGSRVVTGKVVSTDAAGNDHYHLYMHLGTNPNSVNLTPGAGSSALFDGMTADGSKVFFTTGDQLLGADTDASDDIYEADVSPGGALTLSLVTVQSTGAPSNNDGCATLGLPEAWNSVSGSGKCNAVAFAAGAGLASEQGSFYFVSPEQLEAGEGEPNEANLYVLEPGADPKFIGVLDSSTAHPGPPPPLHPLVTANLTGVSHTSPGALTVDQSNGDIYLVEMGTGGTGKLSRYTSAGAAKNFSAVQPYIEANKIKTLTLNLNSGSQVAVDNAASSPFNGNIYVTNNKKIATFAPSGEKLGEISGSTNAKGLFNNPCGVAVDQSNGILYIGDRTQQIIWQYTPKAGATAPVEDNDYTIKGLQIEGFAPCNVAADNVGNVYASRFSNGPVIGVKAASFGVPFVGGAGTELAANSRAVAVDPSSNTLFVNEGNQIQAFNSSQEPLNTFGVLSGSRGVAANMTTHHVYAVTGANVAEFGFELAAYHPIVHPGVVHGVKDAGTYSSADFQVTPDGHYAAFDSPISLTGYSNLGKSEIYRWDTQAEQLDCASCASTGAAAKYSTFLAPYGLNITDDGRVFFTSQEGLVLSDTNEKRDAYEWSGGTNLGKISTGRSLNDSSLLSASRDGKDVFFFTRDILVPTDENGGAVKIYDAREGGGYQQFPAKLPCAASDECHGAGSQAPPPPNINSDTGTEKPDTGGGTATKRCKKGFVKRHGVCKRKRRHHHRKSSHHHG